VEVFEVLQLNQVRDIADDMNFREELK